MLNTLLESKSTKVRNDAVTAASVTVHGVLIIVAAFATAAGAPALPEPEKPSSIVWATIAPSQSPATRSTSRSPEVPPAPSRPIQVSLAFDVPSIVPAVTVPLAAITSADFSRPLGNPTGSVDTTRASGPGGGRRAYTSDEVEVPVSALGGARPDYPAALRSSGIEGQVVAQFVVDESGQALAESVRIVSATDDLFAESVRRSIPKMRFASAQMGSRTVPQMVQQLFVFRLDR